MSSSLKRRAYAYLRERMLVGAIPVGERVSDVEIARELGISRTPVREAIVQLEAQGLIEQHPGVGPRVKSLDRRELEESFELREMLECGAVVVAAQRITPSEIAALDDLCERYDAASRRMREAGVDDGPAPPWGDQLNILDMAFHLKIISTAKNRHLLRVVGDLHLLTRILQRRAELPSFPYLQRLEHIRADHRQIVDALRRRDGLAAQAALRGHLQWAVDYHLQAFDWEQRQRATPGGGSDDVYFPLDVLETLLRMESQGDSGEGA